MKPLLFLALLLAACLAQPASLRAQEEDTEVTFDYFYDALAPYGAWVEVDGYGPCWQPGGVDPEWAPYTEGEWVYTDAGWTFVSEEAYGSIVYHYGRWIIASDLGWVWVPGYEWGPAWVSWRDSDEYVGWAPLPPEVVWTPDEGVGAWVDETYGIGPAFYTFCHHRDFGAPRLRTVILARGWNTNIIIQTVNITRLGYNHERRLPFCGGPAYERISRVSSRPPALLSLERRHDYDFHGEHGHRPPPVAQIVGNALSVVAPHVRAGSSGVHPTGKKTVISRDRVDRGWQGKGASGDLSAVRAKIHAETNGRTPASDPVKVAIPTEVPRTLRRAGDDNPPQGFARRPGMEPRGIPTQPATPTTPGPGSSEQERSQALLRTQERERQIRQQGAEAQARLDSMERQRQDAMARDQQQRESAMRAQAAQQQERLRQAANAQAVRDQMARQQQQDNARQQMQAEAGRRQQQQMEAAREQLQRQQQQQQMQNNQQRESDRRTKEDDDRRKKH